jgi:hypothetical protein
MGQGSKSSADVVKASPRRARRGAHDDSGGGPEPRPAYCELTHSLAMEVADDIQLAVGTPVELVIAAPPRVSSRGREVGQVDDPKARAMERCLREGFRMAGRVRTVAGGGQRAEIVVSGTRGR